MCDGRENAPLWGLGDRQGLIPLRFGARTHAADGGRESGAAVDGRQNLIVSLHLSCGRLIVLWVRNDRWRLSLRQSHMTNPN
ncbi:hypothetical protein OV450_1676 [Actinobacteria bacterium OV450]|nr:hypothetical protein OV450_1676 [Actinobacteria bacterium OV450]